MVMLPLSITTKKSEWVFYTPYTVRVKIFGLLTVMLTLRRSWSVFCAIGLDPVLNHEALVLSLLLFAWNRGFQCSSSSGNISF